MSILRSFYEHCKHNEDMEELTIGALLVNDECWPYSHSVLPHIIELIPDGITIPNLYLLPIPFSWHDKI